MSYFLGKTSLRRLSTCCPTWQKIIKAAIKDSPLDFGVVCGFRGEIEQEEAYRNGRSNARWGESDHNVMRGNNPWSLAVDLAPYADGRFLWEDEEAYAALAGHIMSTAARLGHRVEWGGNYASIKDLPHFSLRL